VWGAGHEVSQMKIMVSGILGIARRHCLR
jgi:hypothetical protein